MHGGGAPQVKAAAAGRVREMLAEALDPDRSLREMARVAFSDIRELFDEHGKLLPVTRWPEDIARAVAGVEVVRGNIDKGDGKFDEVVKLKLWDKGRSLENALKKHGHLMDKMEVTGSVDIVQRLAAARSRANAAARVKRG
jgi:phage terminase small subunit